MLCKCLSALWVILLLMLYLYFAVILKWCHNSSYWHKYRPKDHKCQNSIIYSRSSITSINLSLYFVFCGENAALVLWPCHWWAVSHYQENSVKSFIAQPCQKCYTIVCCDSLRQANRYHFMATFFLSLLKVSTSWTSTCMLLCLL